MKGQLTVRQNRGGVFDGHDIRGMQYEDDSGEQAGLSTHGLSKVTFTPIAGSPKRKSS
jgi:hypothetical protein